MVRTDSPSEVKTEKGHREPWELRADIARQRNISTILAKSGNLSEISDLHMSMRSEFATVHDFGIDVSPMLSALDHLEAMSPDKRRMGKKEAMQLVQDTPIIIPGIGTIPPIPQEDVGRIEHAKRMVFGEPAK